MIIEVSKDSDFSIHNIPFGIFQTNDKSPRAGVAIGEYIIDLEELSYHGVFDFDSSVLKKDTLNDFIALGKEKTIKVRTDIQEWLQDCNSILSKHQELFIKQSSATMLMPVSIGDYTDFYSSEEHATNVGKMFRDPKNAILPNWKHIPVGYHGRASSIVVSGTPLYRPLGQTRPKEDAPPVFGPTKRLDFELEVGFITGKKSSLGDSISLDEAEAYIFGLVLLNDWSARDIQKWEYVPLGPFLSKNFASHISPWIVTLEALEAFRIPGPEQNPDVLPYLNKKKDGNYDIQLEVSLKPEGGEEQTISNSNYRYMYWDMVQQLTHHTVNGCNINVGDLYGSGTISGKEENSYGSMLELAWMGTKPIQLKNGSKRIFIEDGDTVTMRGYGEKNGIRVGFGELTAKVFPAK
ncbi:MAG: fumarylacetoacetase [Flavobacteriaceae bacterium]